PSASRPDSRTEGSRNIREVRYSAIQTNVRMTVLNGCIAQSHIAHEMTCFFVAAGAELPCSRPNAATAPVLAVGGGTEAASRPVMADTLQDARVVPTTPPRRTNDALVSPRRSAREGDEKYE